MRIVGVNIPDNKKVGTALTYIYGVGRTGAASIMKQTGIKETKKAKDLTAEEVNKIQTALEKDHHIEGELRQTVRSNIKRLKDVKAYRGTRHERSLPARGQRTKSNSRTTRGNVRKTAGSGKRKLELK
jgi:small subunit ribosomal protein S13